MQEPAKINNRNGFRSSGREVSMREVDLQAIMDCRDYLKNWVQEQEVYAMRGRRFTSIIFLTR